MLCFFPSPAAESLDLLFLLSTDGAISARQASLSNGLKEHRTKCKQSQGAKSHEKTTAKKQEHSRKVQKKASHKECMTFFFWNTKAVGLYCCVWILSALPVLSRKWKMRSTSSPGGNPKLNQNLSENILLVEEKPLFQAPVSLLLCLSNLIMSFVSA